MVGRRTGLVLLSVAWLALALPAFAEDHSASIVALVARVIPTVVSIQTMRAVPSGHNDPRQASLSPSVLKAEGSGFIVDPTGYIATNRHVVEGAYDVAVTLSDGHSVEAKVVWQSPIVDIAFLKIEMGHPLPAVDLARNQDLKLGQRVVAIGNPLGLGISVSSGIVSALNRNIKQSPYDDFIQTDAAINHGSSGGPLFNEAGEVVGMNTALYAAVANGGSEGLGFAIPGADLTFLIDQLKRDGHIRVGWLGVQGQKVTPAMADALGFPDPYGVIVATINADSPASKAGLRRGDIIQALDDKVLYDITTLNRAVGLAPDKTVSLRVWRNGAFIPINVDLVRMTEAQSGLVDQAKVAAPRFTNASDLGMTLAPVTEEIRRRYGLGADVNGLAVTAVSASGEAEASGLRPGDVITSLQMTPLSLDKPFDETLAQYAKMGRRFVIVLVQSSGGERWITLPVRL